MLGYIVYTVNLALTQGTHMDCLMFVEKKFKQLHSNQDEIYWEILKDYNSLIFQFCSIRNNLRIFDRIIENHF